MTRLNQFILIFKLYDIGIPRDIVVIFVFWFQHMCAIVVLICIPFSMFNVKSCVRQGRMCSCWYTYELILKSEDSGLRCRPHGIFVGFILISRYFIGFKFSYTIAINFTLML